MKGVNGTSFLPLNVGVVAATSTMPVGEYLFMSQDYSTHCLEIDEVDGISRASCPLQGSKLRPFCSKCPDSYNKYTVNSNTSLYFVIPDVGRLNIFLAGEWFPTKIDSCDPFWLQSFGSKLYVLCSIGGRERRVTVYVVDMTASGPWVPHMITVESTTGSLFNPNVAAFFVEDNDVLLCVAMGSTLLFYNFRTALSTPQESTCTFIGQLTPFEREDGRGFLLVECTAPGNDSQTLTMTYNIQNAQLANTSILGSHGLGKNAISSDGNVIASWRGTSCTFSQLQVDSSVTVNFTLGTGAIHSASFITIQTSLLFVMAVTGPNRGLYWFNVTHALTGGGMGGPQFVRGSATVCVSEQCSGIALTDTGFVLAAVRKGMQVEFFSLFNNSHFGPIGIDSGAARIGVISSGKATHPGGYLPPRHPLEKTIGLSIGSVVSVAFGIIVIIAGTVIAICCARKHCKCKRYV